MSQNPVLQLFNQAAPLLQRYLSPDDVQQAAQNLTAKAQQSSPVIMLYGLFNAGKSTLINALIGDEVAPEGSVPTTAQVQAYYWRGYQILDSPGMDANQAHSATTQAQLLQSDVVIMVLNSRGATEEQASYQGILQLLAQGRQVLVVINNTDDVDVASGEVASITDAVRAQLVQQAVHYPANVQVHLYALPLLWLNARAGLNGKLQHKQALLDYSGLPVFERTLQQAIERTAKADLLRVQACQLQPLFSQALQGINEQTQPSKAACVAEQSLVLQQQQQLIQGQLFGVIQQQSRHLKPGLKAALQQPDTAEHYLVTLSAELGQALQRAFEQQLAPLAAQWEQAEMQLQANNALASVMPECDWPRDADNLFAEQGQLSKPQVAELVNSLSRQQIEQALAVAQKVLPNLFGKMAKNGAGPLADKLVIMKASPWLLVIQEMLGGVWRYYRSQQQQDEQVAQSTRYQQQLNDVVEQFAAQYSEQAERAVNECLTPIFANAQQWLTQQSNQQDTQLIDDQQQLANYQHQLAQLAA
ncbi:hypothetical protein CBP31_13040 [Oceanisphaera profunda]|uniref:G domain-containing protein n=1 Tax=Oceanisphaera profunda TaxID=1416627 RepID=A0A1Y0D793_9GAMM|nr:dynamin family protein [Oceanisphaera profunda]ART83432.1 hypothetical protein CBP31_13040 [Oceanisphaera profunda]